jgi:2-polyprenyl-6-methoxyphenol hydroxylase-like FAD-dependent oxidoreductase
MTRVVEAQVVVVGGGPVGLCLAMDLARRGINVVVVETRGADEAPSPKCNHVAARTMEIFRQLGVVQAVRHAGLPEDYPNDVAYRTTFVGPELSRIPIPCRRDRYTARGGPDTWWPTPEPPHRINQIYLEPILNEHARSCRGLQILYRTRFGDFQQRPDGVVAMGEDLESGETITMRCEYLIGCDGGRSLVRKKMGALFAGTEVVGLIQSTYFRAPDLLSRALHQPAWATFSINPRRSGNVYAIDGRETFIMHNYLRPGEDDFEAVDRDRCLRTILGVGSDFAYEVLAKEDWTSRRLIADRFRDRRVFICGDAAHIWVPMAGYGMNAGIADAMNLSWTLAARLQGWGAEGILSAYEAERHPITEQVSTFAMNHALALQRAREGVSADIELAGPAGELARTKTGKMLYDLNVKQYCCAGLNFGYFYDVSPIVVYDGEPAPSYTMDTFTPSTVPGCRTPHLWLEDGQSLYDACGSGFALLRFDRAVPAQPLLNAAEQRGLPMRLIDIPQAVAAGIEMPSLLISRPDQHVAWRGAQVPDRPLEVIDRIRGAMPAEARRP